MPIHLRSNPRTRKNLLKASLDPVATFLDLLAHDDDLTPEEAEAELREAGVDVDGFLARARAKRAEHEVVVAKQKRDEKRAELAQIERDRKERKAREKAEAAEAEAYLNELEDLHNFAPNVDAGASGDEVTP